MLPVIIILHRIRVRNVPNSLREAGLALGAKPHKVSMRIVLPSALTGIVTARYSRSSRAVARRPGSIGDWSGFTNAWQPFNPVSALPLSIFENAKSEWPVNVPKSGEMP